MNPDPVDVVVVGAGPTGLALALQSIDHGATVRIMERRRERFRPSRALIMHPRTLEVLRPLGVTDELLAKGDVAPRAQLHLRFGVVCTELDRFDLADTAFPYLMLIRQADVEAVLSDALALRGVAIERDTEVVSVTAGLDDATVTLDRGTHANIACRYLVGCDGPMSIVRTAMRTTWTGAPYRQEVVLADLELACDLEPGVAHVAPGPKGVVFLFALGEHATWRLLATRPVDGTDLPFGQPGPPVPQDALRGLLARSGLPAEIADVRWSARVPLQHRIAGVYRSGRLFLAGDAAHTHSPAGGQGMNTGIQDATNLGWKLAFATQSGHDPARTATLLDSYGFERRPVARRVLAMTNAIFWAEAATDPLARAARALVATIGTASVPVLLRRRRLLAAGARTLGQLRVNYRHSPLACNGTRPRKGLPRAGDRLPDAPVMTSAGPTRLHALTAHAGIDLILQRDAPDPPTLPPSISIHRLVDAPGTGVMAVRPDGYLGFSGDGAEPRQLAAWLQLVHPPQHLAASSLPAPRSSRP